MALIDCPFSLIDNVPRPYLPIRIINPHTGMSFPTWGLIDTGADECAVPARLAPLLGHNLALGYERDIITGSGPTKAYSHTTKIEIYNPHTYQLEHSIDNALIDYMSGLLVPLLGVKSFLRNFILHIDYHHLNFSLTR